MSLLSGTSLRLLITKPTNTGGQSITKYKIEWDTSSLFNVCGVICSKEVAVGSMGSLRASLGGKLIYDITNLQKGTIYYARVFAYSSVGYGAATIASTHGSSVAYPASPKEAPSTPQDAKITTETIKAAPITSLDVSWQPPVSNGGSPLTGYKVEWWTAKRIAEVQTVQTTNTNGGSFLLYLNGETTAALSHDITAANMRYKLMSIAGSPIKELSVTRSDGVKDGSGVPTGYTWSITFLHSSNDGDLPSFVGVKSLSPSGATLTVQQMQKGRRSQGANEKQVILLRNDGSKSTGYFQLSFNGAGPTSYLPVDASDAQMKSALESLHTVGQISVTRHGDMGSSTSGCGTGRIVDCKYGYKWVVEFTSNWATSTDGDIPVITVTTQPSAGAITIYDGDNAVGASPFKLVCTECAIGETPAAYNHAIVSATTFAYQITGLTAGEAVYAQVTARNDRGYGGEASAVGVASICGSTSYCVPPKQVPSAPKSPSVGVFSGDSSKLLVSFSSPQSNGGSDILKYKIEWDTTAAFSNAGSIEYKCPNNPVRKVVVVTTAKANGGTDITGGTFRLKLTKGGIERTTTKIKWSSVAMSTDETLAIADIYKDDGTSGNPNDHTGSMQSVLQDLSNIGGKVNVIRTGPTNGGYSWTITFLGDGNDFVLAPTATALTASGTPTVGITNQIAGQTFTSCTGSQTIPGLVQGTPYFTRVVAYNALGYGPAAKVANAQAPIVQPAAPTGASLSFISASSLRVQFYPPTDDGGASVDEYLVEWDISAQFNSNKTNNGPLGSHRVLYLDGGSPFIYTISGLSAGTRYYCRVKAHNSQGYGASGATSPASEYPRTTPSAPTNVLLGTTAGTKLTVKFSAPSNTGGDAVTKYRVDWDTTSTFTSLQAQPHKGSTEVNGADASSLTLSGLTLGQVYYVRVAASNSVGYGPVQSASPSFAQTALQVPGKPSDISLANLAFTSDHKGRIEVKFSSPLVPAHGYFCGGGGTTTTAVAACPSGMGYGTEADGGSAIARYEIEHDTVATFDSSNASPHKATTRFTPSSSRPHRHEITGLDCSREYYVRVHAYNSEGSGPVCNKQGTLCDGSVLKLQPTC
jgi:hypothetical protein